MLNSFIYVVESNNSFQPGSLKYVRVHATEISKIKPADIRSNRIEHSISELYETTTKEIARFYVAY